MQKSPYDEMRVRTLQQQQKCITSLKICQFYVHKFQSFVNIFFKIYTNYQIRPYVVLPILLIERACTAVHNEHNSKPH